MSLPDGLSAELLEILADPIDLRPLRPSDDGSAVINDTAEREYPVQEGILLLHPSAGVSCTRTRTTE
jgi:uncharacterized protein YbaR (Trm112 family)